MEMVKERPLETMQEAGRRLRQEQRALPRRRFFKNRLAVLGGAITILMLLIAILAPVLSPYGPYDMVVADRLQAPSAAHPFGTDALGRDLLLRTLKGLSTSMTVGIAASLISAGIAVLVGIASSGVHSNGFSLVRKVFDIRRENLPALTAYDEKLGKSLLDALLTPTRIYVQSVLPLLTQVNVRSICHITGGGFYENIPRALPAGVSASIQKSSYSVPPIFRKIQAAGDIPERDMYNTFNMGLGLCVIVPREEAGKALTILEKQGELAWKVGEVISGGEGVELW